MVKVGFNIIVLFFMVSGLYAQKYTPLPHGSTFGKRVDTLQNIPATKLEAFMGKMTRISTSIHGKVLKVDKTKGGWFELDAGDGKIIKAHFQDYRVNIPMDLKGRNVMIQGVAQKLDKSGPTNKLSFEVIGLTVL